MSVPPSKAPYYDHGGWFRMGSDEPQFRHTGKFTFEFIDPDRGDDPHLACRYYAGEFARVIAAQTVWHGNGGWLFRPGAARQEGERHLVEIHAGNAERALDITATIALSPDPSGWTRIDAIVGGETVFTAYLDRVYEEFDLWPPGASGAGEAPGRIGKRQTWASLSADAWPVLRAMTGEDFLAIEMPDL